MQDPLSISNKCYRELEYLSAGLTCPYRQHVICTFLPDLRVLPLYRLPVTTDSLVLAVPSLHLLHLTDQVVDLGLHGL